MVEEHLSSGGAAPADQVASTRGLAIESPPEHAGGQSELAREIGQHGGMAEGVGRIEHVGAAPDPLRLRTAEEKIADQRLT